MARGWERGVGGEKIRARGGGCIGEGQIEVKTNSLPVSHKQRSPLHDLTIHCHHSVLILNISSDVGIKSVFSVAQQLF